MENFIRSSTDPQNSGDMAEAACFLKKISRFKISRFKKCDLDEYILMKIKGKRVLDVGCIKHDLSYMFKPTWKHAKISKSSSICLGVDCADENLIGLAVEHGYNIKKCDATSDVDLGQRFDFVNVGDVIEHVDNTVALLKFCKRHLESPESKVIITPPQSVLLSIFAKYFSRK